jgi:hypothetical protein
MNIQEISNNIDSKLAQVNLQIEKTTQQLQFNDEHQPELQQELNNLNNIKIKLMKSRRIMWQAHELQKNSDKQALRKKQLLGLGISIIGGAGLLLVAITLVF